MHILIDVRLLSRGSSGIEEYTRQLVQSLVQHASEHEFILWHNSFRRRHLPPELLAPQNVRAVNFRIPNALLNFSARFFRTPNIARALRADVVISPHFDSLTTGRVPRILVLHDLSFLHHPYFFSRRQRLWHWLQGYRAAARRAAHIVTNTEYTKGDIVRLLGIPREKISVIYPGIPISSHVPVPEEIAAFRARCGLVRPFFLSLSTLEPRKNVIAAIDAFTALKRNPHLKEHQLVIAGRHGWLFHPILARASRSVAKNDILFIGPVAAEEKPLLYAAAGCLLFPSFFEGFGFPPLEAQLMGTPVIAAARTASFETLRDSAILINPWQTHKLADAMRQIVLDAPLREELRRRSRANAARFSWEASAREFLSLINRIHL